MSKIFGDQKYNNMYTDIFYVGGAGLVIRQQTLRYWKGKFIDTIGVNLHR